MPVRKFCSSFALPLPHWILSFRHGGFKVRECCDLPNLAQRWLFSTVLSLHWFYEPVPAEYRWCELYTWMKHSLPSVLGAPLCCLHLLPPINAHILNILQSTYAQCGFAGSVLQTAHGEGWGPYATDNPADLAAACLQRIAEGRRWLSGRRDERQGSGRKFKLLGGASGKLPAVSDWCHRLAGSLQGWEDLWKRCIWSVLILTTWWKEVKLLPFSLVSVTTNCFWERQLRLWARSS